MDAVYDATSFAEVAQYEVQVVVGGGLRRQQQELWGETRVMGEDLEIGEESFVGTEVAEVQDLIIENVKLDTQLKYNS